MISRAGTEGRNTAWLLLSAVVFLAGYYAAWVLHYQGSLAPVTRVRHRRHAALYYFFVASWMKDYLALVPCVIFGIAHVAITWSNYVR